MDVHPTKNVSIGIDPSPFACQKRKFKCAGDGIGITALILAKSLRPPWGCNAKQLVLRCWNGTERLCFRQKGTMTRNGSGDVEMWRCSRKTSACLVKAKWLVQHTSTARLAWYSPAIHLAGKSTYLVGKSPMNEKKWETNWVLRSQPKKINLE